ncbi:MAG: TonB-dependent receptor [Caulobacteraceae bacterium]
MSASAAAICAFAAAPGAHAAQAAAAAQSTPTTVGELIVTAQRRAQNIQTVPVAVTALSAQRRALVGIQTVQDLTDYTPGLSYSPIDDRPYIRGVGRNTDNLSTASAVATYYNGVYYGANGAIILQKDDLFISNIEVDRGPQNTLHGSNSDGGTILYTSQRPTDTYYAEARGLVGNYDKYMGEAAVSGPINDHIKIRLGGMYTSEGRGYFNNLDGPSQGGDISLGSSGTEQYLEAQVQANYGHLDAWAMVSGGDIWANYHDEETVGNIPTNLLLNGTFAPSGFYGLCGLPGVAASPNGVGCAGGPPIVPGSVVTDPVTANLFPGNNPGNINRRDFIQEFTSSNNQKADIAVALNLTYHFPDFDLAYIGGYQMFDYELNFNTAPYSGTDAGVESYQLAGPPGLGNLTVYPTPDLTYFAERDRFFSHELDLTSTTSSPFQYLVGLYWYHERYNQPVSAGVEPLQTQFANPFYIDGFGVACPGGAPICPAPPNPQSAASTSDTQLVYDDLAGFAGASYKFGSQWKINGGLRYTYDHKAGIQYWRFEEFDAIPGLDSVALGALTPATDLTPVAIAYGTYPGTGPAIFNPVTGNGERSLGATWKAVTGEADIDWTPDPSTLAYLRYSRGYKSGGFSTYTIGANPETQPEDVDSFELGGKKTMGDSLMVNAAAFYYHYTNDQVPLTVQNAQGLLVPVIYNLPLVHTYGFELEAAWHPIKPLTFNLSYAFLSAKIANAGGCIESTVDPLALQPGSNTAGCTQTSPTAIVQNINGQTLPEAPRNKVAFNALYTLDFEPGSLTLSGSVIWKDVTYDDVFNRWFSKQPAYTLVNLRATWTDAKNRFNIILYCNNVFNSVGYDATAAALLLQGPPEDIVASYDLTPPRTYGAELEVRFR